MTTAAAPGELPRIVSVDDHVVEPPHVWERWLPKRLRDRGPRIERRGIGAMRHVGGGVYEQTFDDDGPPADCWVFEDLVYVHKRHVAAVGFDRDDMTMSRTPPHARCSRQTSSARSSTYGIQPIWPSL